MSVTNCSIRSVPVPSLIHMRYALIFIVLVIKNHSTKGAFPPSHFCNKLDDKVACKVALVSL
jgi:hypothetical protein